MYVLVGITYCRVVRMDKWCRNLIANVFCCYLTYTINNHSCLSLPTLNNKIFQIGSLLNGNRSFLSFLPVSAVSPVLGDFYHPPK